jgi:large subunit ribosomal protein L10
MSLSIDQKKAVVSEVTQALSAAQAAVLAEYRGLTVAQITKLRSEARNLGVDVRVVKNTLARRIVADSIFECLTDHFTGPLVISSSEDPVAVAKLVSTFAKDNEELKITIGAIMVICWIFQRFRLWPNCPVARSCSQHLWARWPRQ